MTVASTTSKVSYAGNGSTTAFTVSFYFLDNSHLKVVLRSSTGTETVKTITTDYTVSGAGNPAGGTVTMLVAPATGQTLVITRNVPLTQDVDYQPNDPFPANTHEQALDKLTMITQQQQNSINQVVRFPVSDSSALTAELPASSSRANKALVFDASGNVGVSVDNYNDQATAAAASAAAAASSASSASSSASSATASASSASSSASAASSSAGAASTSAAAAAAAAASGMYSAVQDKSANYSVVSGDAGDLIRVTTTSGAITITLPLISGAGIGDGFKIAIVKWTGDTNAVNIARSGSDTINGATSYSIGSQYSSATFVADLETAQWFAVASGIGTTNAVIDVFSGNGSTTAFTLSGDPGSKNNTGVYVSGVYQAKSTYSVSGTTLTFTGAPPSGTSNIEVSWVQPLAIGVPSDGTVTAAKLSTTAISDKLGYTPANDSLAAHLAGAETMTAAKRGAVSALTDGATITPDFSAANNFSVTLGGNRTLANPTNQVAGQSGVITITQDGTGSRTLAYGSNWKFPGGTAPTLTTTASAVDSLAYYVESASRITAKLNGDVK